MTDGPQSGAGLNLTISSAETLSMSVSAPHPQTDRRLVFTSSQAARYLGVSLATIRRWTDAGHISCYRTPGGQRRFSRDQLDNFISSLHRDGPTVRSEVVRRQGAEVA
jgi:excisionase family DNA binding protein